MIRRLAHVARVAQRTVQYADTIQDNTLGKTARVAQGTTGKTANIIAGGPARNVRAFLDTLQVCDIGHYWR
jgi:hypothetical protein